MQSGFVAIWPRTHLTMANITDRLPQNIPGLFYVDSSCIDCNLCRSLAPAFFRRDDETGVSIVHRQPHSSEEIDEAEDALRSCPTESIGREVAVARAAIAP